MCQFICLVTVKKRGFLLIFVYNLVVLIHLDFTNYDIWMANYSINLWNVLDFICNSLLSVKADVTFAQGMMIWNITNVDSPYVIGLAATLLFVATVFSTSFRKSFFALRFTQKR